MDETILLVVSAVSLLAGLVLAWIITWARSALKRRKNRSLSAAVEKLATAASLFDGHVNRLATGGSGSAGSPDDAQGRILGLIYALQTIKEILQERYREFGQRGAQEVIQHALNSANICVPLLTAATAPTIMTPLWRANCDALIAVVKMQQLLS